MALINCPDCNKEVSENAQTCIGCGAPIAAKREAAQIQMIQETSKQLKAQSLISGILVIIGLVSVLAVSNANEDPVISKWMLVFGTGWFFVTRYRIWWHHK